MMIPSKFGGYIEYMMFPSKFEGYIDVTYGKHVYICVCVIIPLFDYVYKFFKNIILFLECHA